MYLSKQMSRKYNVIGLFGSISHFAAVWSEWPRRHSARWQKI